MTTEQHLDNIGDPIYIDNNPFKKLMEGFCRPKKMMARASNDDDDDDDDDDYYAADKYAPDLAPSRTHKNHEEEKGNSVATTPELSTTIKAGTNNSSKVISELPTDGSTIGDQITTDTSYTTNPSPISPGTNTATTKQESQPGIEVSKRVTMMRRKRGIENIIMACIFVLTTLLTLKKLGFTTSDFEFISIVGGGDDDNNGSSSTSKSWIHVFDKELTIEKGKIGVDKLASAKAKLIDKIEEENDDIDEEDDTEEDDNESSYEDNKNDGDEDGYNSESSPEAEDEL